MQKSKKLHILYCKLSLVFFLACTSFANAGENYMVTHIFVEYTSENATQARKNAINLAQIKAFKILLSKMGIFNITKQDVLNKIPDLVSDFTVFDEDISYKNYSAFITVSFNKVYFDHFIKQHNFNIYNLKNLSYFIYDNDVPKKLYLLCMPINYSAADSAWFELFNKLASADESNNFKVINTDFLSHNHYDHFNPFLITDKYYRNFVFRSGADGMIVIDIDTDELIAKMRYFIKNFDYKVQRKEINIIGSRDSKIYYRALSKIFSEKIYLTSDNQDKQINKQQFELTVKFNSIDEWLKIKKNIMSIVPVSEIVIERMSYQYVDVVIGCECNLSDFNQAIQDKNLSWQDNSKRVIIEYAS